MAEFVPNVSDVIAGEETPSNIWHTFWRNLSKHRDLYLGEHVNVRSYGAKGDGVTDDSAAFASALANGAGTAVFVPSGTYIISSTLFVPPNTTLFGCGQTQSILKMAANANIDMIANLPPSAGGVIIEKIGFEGNDANNLVSGRAVAWTTGATGENPAVILRDVIIQHFRGGVNFEAVNFIGSIGVQFFNVSIVNNRFARGMFLQTPDGSFVNLYMRENGGANGLETLVIRAANTNRFVNCYFGGGTGNRQVYIWGGLRNEFLNCVNDRAWTHGYEITDSGAPGLANENAIIGGNITNPGQETTNTYDHLYLSGAVDRTRIIGVSFENDSANQGRYAYSNAGTGYLNIMQGCNFGTFGTAIYGATPAGDCHHVMHRPLSMCNDAGITQICHTYQGAGVPNNANGIDGDYYFRTDTPGVALQRLYVKGGGIWAGIV